MSSTAYLGSSLVNGLSPYTADPDIIDTVLRDFRQGDDKDPIYKELWHACAGPHVNIPSVGEKVFYCPQGHLEQVALNTNQQIFSDLPTHNLPYKIACIVIHVHLEVDEETDEVVAKVTLLPETQYLKANNHLLLGGTIPSQPQERPNITSFKKTLSNSDSLNRNGLLLIQGTEQLFPPLDMTMEKPAQDLVAKDLQGREWHFRHIYRGSEKRHVISSGWNAFGDAKKIEPGDVIIFIRSEYGKFHVGVRHSKKLVRKSHLPVLTSRNVQLGLLSVAYHAVRSESMFTVYYRPMSSPAEFLIPYAPYTMSLERNVSVGMMCTTKSENNDIPERRFIGTIIGIEYIDQVRWAGSLWRCLKIQRHGLIRNDPERISPWDVAPLATTDERLCILPDLIIKQHYQAKQSLAAASVNLGFSLQDSIASVAYREYYGILHSQGIENSEYRIEEEQSLPQSNSDSSQPRRKKLKIRFPYDENKNALKTCRIFSVFMRNQVQVHKYGNLITREVDIARLNGYEELYSKIDQMFNFRGDLMKKCYWCMMYKDNEEGYTFVGDSSWTLFCSIAQKLFICPKEVMEKLQLRSHTSG